MLNYDKEQLLSNSKQTKSNEKTKNKTFLTKIFNLMIFNHKKQNEIILPLTWCWTLGAIFPASSRPAWQTRASGRDTSPGTSGSVAGLAKWTARLRTLVQ